jgi:hypothetical protein
MKIDQTEIEINGVKYIQKDSVIANEMAPKVDGLPFVIIRTYSAGVHMGYLKSRNWKEVQLLKTRRIWYWAGAASLSQLAHDGTTKPNDCKFTVELESIELMEAIEVIPVTAKAEQILKSVNIWKM